MKQVIDTNVLLVANKKHSEVSIGCVTSCIQELRKAQDNTVVIDDDYRMIKEYLHKTSPNQPKGTGDVFLKWLLRNEANPNKVEKVTLTETGTDAFREFPDQTIQPEIDPPDRKFIAVAYAHPDKPKILQATDCKWLDWLEWLNRYHIEIKFVCRGDVERFYAKKFPNRVAPTQ